MSFISRIPENIQDPDCPKRCEEGQRLHDALTKASESTALIMSGEYGLTVTELNQHYRTCPQCASLIEYLKSN